MRRHTNAEGEYNTDTLAQTNASQTYLLHIIRNAARMSITPEAGWND